MRTESREDSYALEDSYELSPIQQGMLFHHLRDQHSGVDIEQMVIDMREPLEATAFEQSWQRVVDRHAVLRTRFRWEGLKEPLQEVSFSAKVAIEQHDWRARTTAEQEQGTEVYLRSDRRRGFDLREAPVLRLALFRLGDAAFRLIWTFHHILIDGRSFVIILKEVFGFYQAIYRGKTLELETPHPYRAYIEWIKQLDLSGAPEFWTQKLKGFSAPTPLPLDRDAAGVGPEEARYEAQEIRLPEALSSGLRSLAKEENLTLNTLIQGAWALLLSRYSGEEDVVFGATKTARRSSVEQAESIVGLFLNTVPVRVRVSEDRPLLAWLKQLRSEWVSLGEYEHTPLVRIKEWSDLPAGSPLFHSLVVFENQRFDAVLQAEGRSWRDRKFRLLEQTNYSLTLAAYGNSELLLKIEYDGRCFERLTITRMLGHLGTLLGGMAANPTRRISDLPWLTEAERHQVLVEWNDTRVDYPGDLCLHELIERQVERAPESTALVYGRQTLSYREMNARANQLAHHLRRLGVGPEVLVGIYMERSLEMVVGLLAILKAGGAYVPLDPAYPKERLTFMLEDSQAPVLLAQEGLAETLLKFGAHVVSLTPGWWANSSETTGNPASGATVQNLAYVIYTSGSTGRPKGVQVEHRAVCNLVETQAGICDVRPGSRILQFCSLSFDPSIFDIGVALRSGATLCLAPQESLLPGPAMIRLLRDQAVTMITLPPSILVALPDEELPALQTVVVGAEPCSPDVLRRWGRNRRFFNIYGVTEAAVFSTIAECSDNGRRPPIGRPIANTQIYLLDSRLRPVPVGVPGELHIGGAGLARGYLNRPELTAERFIPNPFSKEPGARLYKTGDLARYLPDGNVNFLARIDHQVKVRGYRIELGEIEAVLAEHPVVRESVVTACQDAAGDKSLAAYIVPKREAPITASELRNFLKKKLPDYMMPSAFVLLDALPLSPNGKVDHRALPSAAPAGAEPGRTCAAPRDALECQLAKIWEETLGARPIGLTDNFFELGGHSLLAVSLFDRIEKVLGKNLPLSILFKAPTIEQLAPILREEGWSVPWVVEIQSGSSRRPFFCAYPSLAFRNVVLELGPDQPVYGLQHQSLFEGKPTPALKDTIKQLAQHMRALQPEGPYFLGGACNAGKVAFAIAQELYAQGQKVALLTVFDTPGPDYPSLPSGTALPFAQRIGFHLRRLFTLRGQNQVDYVRTRLRNVKRYFIGRMYEIRYKYYAARGRPLPHALQDPAKILRQQIRDYAPDQAYPGRVTLFRPIERPGGDDHDPGLGWSRIAAGGVEIHYVPGDHDTQFLKPNSVILGQQLKACLDKAQAIESDPMPELKRALY